MSKLLKIQSQKHKEVIDITELVNECLESLGATSGLCHIFSKHTTTAISVADLDSGGTDLDYLEAFEKIVPKLNYRHPHDPSHMPDHVLSAGIGPGTLVPVVKGTLDLGTWQRVLFFDFDGPKQREIVVTIIEQK
jgi:secondary thiamine-phosphate synthase enzyme